MSGDNAGQYLLILLAALIAIEALVSHLFAHPAYDLRSSETNFGVVFGWLIVAPLTTILVVLFITLGNRFALIAAPEGIVGFILLFLAADFIYYVWHRANHKFRWLWATHNVHHSAERLNFLAALRQGWTEVLGGIWLFFAPLGLLGFSPATCFTYFAVLQIWQMLAHNEWMTKLGPLEWILVTPSNHRIHHSLSPEHVDRNFGGLFVIWDRIFRTYVAEGDEIISGFGFADGPPSRAGILKIVFWGWIPIWHDARNFAGRFLRH
jgi:sterol desaturase/sphingolipid hydroxylase (fatty acid hydroxylase superfamily)